jgi:hypothetical protein
LIAFVAVQDRFWKQHSNPRRKPSIRRRGQPPNITVKRFRSVRTVPARPMRTNEMLKNGTVVRLDFERGLPRLVETTTTAVPGNQPTASEAAKGGTPTDHSPNPNRSSSD